MDEMQVRNMNAVKRKSAGCTSCTFTMQVPPSLASTRRPGDVWGVAHIEMITQKICVKSLVHMARGLCILTYAQ